MPATASIALGSNLGDRRMHLQRALEAIAALPGTGLLAASSFLETEPIGPVSQGRFLNAAVLIQTELSPRALLDALLAIEHRHGRDRSAEHRWGPRTLDLDLLLFGDSVIHEQGLTVPHPRLHERLFVLQPLAEIGPDLVVPTLGKSVRQLRDTLLETARETTRP